MRPERPKVVFAGSLAQRAGRGGSTWARLQWALGFKRLGWDVLYLDSLDPGMCVDAGGRPSRPEESVNLAYFVRVMNAFGLGDSSVLLSGESGPIAGRTRRELLSFVSASTGLFNVMGFVRDDDVLAASPRRIFLDIDPGFGQMWRAERLADVFAGHDDFVTIGENVGRAGCSVPTCGKSWITTPQPIVMSEWPVQTTPGDRFTSVASWRGAYSPVHHNGTAYGLRVHEFRRFVRLPELVGLPFELALDIHPADAKDMALLDANGWRLADPRAVAGDPWSYRRYVQGSRGEFMVAKNMYTTSRSGWFSDRTMCYLASGRPAIVQDTGFSHRYPTGEGLLAFTTLDEAASAVMEVEANYELHARSARRVAENHFASDIVLRRLLDELSVPC
jgi:hypothetical protein